MGTPGSKHNSKYLPTDEQGVTTDRQRLPRTSQTDMWSSPPAVSNIRSPGVQNFDYAANTYTVPSPQSLRSPSGWPNPAAYGSQSFNNPSIWPTSGAPQVQVHNRSPSSRSSNWTSPRPAHLLRRISSEDASLRGFEQEYYDVDMASSVPSLPAQSFAQRRPANRDEFDGPAQFLNKPHDNGFEPREDDMPTLPVSLQAQEQDEVLAKVNDTLSKCAFDFVAKYQFPIPLEPDKREVQVPSDREWQEWCFLLKRLATKRRIPARVLFNGQIKQLITTLENSLEMRHAAKHQSRPLKDDRNILQLISSGLQVAKILKDGPAMRYLDLLYTETERKIEERKERARCGLPVGGYSAVARV